MTGTPKDDCDSKKNMKEVRLRSVTVLSQFPSVFNCVSSLGDAAMAERVFVTWHAARNAPKLFEGVEAMLRRLKGQVKLGVSALGVRSDKSEAKRKRRREKQSEEMTPVMALRYFDGWKCRSLHHFGFDSQPLSILSSKIRCFDFLVLVKGCDQFNQF